MFAKIFKFTYRRRNGQIKEDCRVLSSNRDCVISVCNKGKTALKLFLSLFFEKGVVAMNSVFLPSKVSIVINLFALPLNNLLKVCFSSQEPSKLPREIFNQSQNGIFRRQYRQISSVVSLQSKESPGTR